MKLKTALVVLSVFFVFGFSWGKKEEKKVEPVVVAQKPVAAVKKVVHGAPSRIYRKPAVAKTPATERSAAIQKLSGGDAKAAASLTRLADALAKVKKQ